MTVLKAIFMGLIQGLTEFLPVSSSGHLAIFKNLFNVNTDTGLLFDVLLHVATLIAVCIVYYKDVIGMIVEFFKMLGDIIHNLIELFNGKRKYRKIISNMHRKLVIMILISSVPTAIIGFAAKDMVEAFETALLVPGIFLIVTSILLFIADRLEEGNKTIKEATYTDSLILGIAQGVATMPGLSRSGTTIFTCLLCKFDRNLAVKYSFLMSLPAIGGAALLELSDVEPALISGSDIGCYIAGMIVAGIVGFICIKVMLLIVRKKKFTYFSIYCLVIGVLSIVGYFCI
ncbi:MAG: undecaprenyl-diphosphate phosphatase [Lachnospiraceae bacterium]|nr:undecaprenyl-diphosphate phosphatase [Lachnospiraceae bacterium]